MNFILVAIGGFLGSMVRYCLSLIFHKHFIGTWIANFSGSVLLGSLVNLQLDGNIAEWIWLVAGIGFCGAFTTFSTFGNESFTLFLEKRYVTAFGYVAGTVIVTLLTVFLIAQ